MHKTKFFKRILLQILQKHLVSKYKKLELSDIDFKNAFSLVDKEKDAKELLTKEEKKGTCSKT